MKEFVKKLGKYNLSFSREVFYVLLHCIDKKIDNFDDLVVIYKDRDDYKELYKDYKEFYDFMIDYFESMDLNKDMIMHHKIIQLIDTILEDSKKLQDELKLVISNVIDIVFLKYNLNISTFNTNEEIKSYLLNKIGDDRVVDLLILLLLADTSLSSKDVESIPEEEFENIISSIILISIYICKGLA